MSKENAGLNNILVAALVAALISAAGIGLFVANQPEAPAPVQQAKTETPPPSADLTDKQKKSVEAIVRNFLVSNPEILIEMSTQLEQKQAEAEQKAREKAISENADAIYREKDPLIAGNPNGNVTIVEFSDYNCPYCKRAFISLTKLLEADPNIRVVMKEFPIFGEPSIGAARVAVAAHKQGRYFDMHAALLKAQGRSSEASALRLAETLGLDVEKLKQDMKSPEVMSTIARTRALGEKLGVRGTPFYLVGDRVVPGAPDDLYDVLVKTVAEIREKGCTAAC